MAINIQYSKLGMPMHMQEGLSNRQGETCWTGVLGAKKVKSKSEERLQNATNGHSAQVGVNCRAHQSSIKQLQVLSLSSPFVHSCQADAASCLQPLVVMADACHLEDAGDPDVAGVGVRL
jgi:hypothetical protein